MPQMQKPQMPRAVVVAFMGDSITAGQYIDPDLRWTALVSNALLREYLATPVNFHVLNRGVSGETTRQGFGTISQQMCSSTGRTS